MDQSHSSEDRLPRSTILIFSFGAALLGCVVPGVMMAMYGVAVSPDSAAYLAGAYNIASGQGFVDFAGRPIVSWPPMISVIWMIPMLLGVPHQLGVVLINLLCCGAFWGASTALLLRLSGSRIFTTIAIIAALLNPEMNLIFARALSEPVFLALLALWFCSLYKFLKLDDPTKTMRCLVISVLMVALLIQTRLVAVVCGGVLGLAVIYRYQDSGIRNVLMKLLLVGFFLLLPLELLMIRNFFLTETVMGSRYPAALSFTFLLNQYDEQLSLFFFYSNRGIVVAMIGFLLIMAFLYRQSRHVPQPLFWMLLAFILVYTGFLFHSQYKYVLAALSPRFICPLFMPVLMVLAIAYRDSKRAGMKRLSNMLTVMLIAMAFRSVPVTTGWLQKVAVDGIPSLALKEGALDGNISEIMTENAKVYSNNPELLTFHYLIPASILPQKHVYNNPQIPVNDLVKFREEQVAGPVMIVWYKQTYEKDHLYRPEELLEGKVHRIGYEDDKVVVYTSNVSH